LLFNAIIFNFWNPPHFSRTQHFLKKKSLHFMQFPAPAENPTRRPKIAFIFGAQKMKNLGQGCPTHKKLWATFGSSWAAIYDIFCGSLRSRKGNQIRRIKESKKGKKWPGGCFFLKKKKILSITKYLKWKYTRFHFFK